MTKTYCDRCGAEVTDIEPKVHLAGPIYADGCDLCQHFFLDIALKFWKGEEFLVPANIGKLLHEKNK